MFNLSESIAALADKIDRGGRLSRSEAKTFLSEAPLALLGLLATHAKERKSGKAVFYNRNFHIASPADNPLLLHLPFLLLPPPGRLARRVGLFQRGDPRAGRQPSR